MRQMICRTLFASLLFPCVVWADIAPPAGTKYFDPRVRFVGVEKAGDYVFFLWYETGSDLRFLLPTSIHVKSDAEVTLKNTGRFISRSQLLALPRQEFDKKKGEPPSNWLHSKLPGVLTASVDTPNNIGSKFSLRAPLTEYRVTLKDGKLSVATLTKQRSDAGPMPGWGVGLLIALSFVGLGVWFARRRSV